MTYQEKAELFADAMFNWDSEPATGSCDNTPNEPVLTDLDILD